MVYNIYMDNTELIPLVFMLSCMALYIIVIFGGIALWVWMLVDAIKRENYNREDEKITWIIVLALTGAIGAAIYFFAVKRKYDRKNTSNIQRESVD
jgi:prolipoprotein diacylglyceryltransferase